MSISLADSVERGIAAADAKQIVDSIGQVIAKAPEMDDDKVFDAMEKILATYIEHMIGKCPRCRNIEGGEL